MPKKPSKKTSSKKKPVATAARKSAKAKPQKKKAAAAPKKAIRKSAPKPKAAPRAKPSSKPAPPKPKPQPKPKPKPAVKPKPKARRVHFSPTALQSIRDNLVTERTELEEQLKEIEESVFQSPQSEVSGEVGYDTDDYADAGSATFEREKDLSIANNVQDLLVKVNRALEKIDEGTYGVCESCGNPIDSARLKALPSVVLCLDCKKREERR